MSNEIIVKDSDSNVLEYVEVRNSGLGVKDGAKDMVVISEFNPSIPNINPPFTPENVFK